MASASDIARAGHDEWADAMPERRAAAQQAIAVADGRKRADAQLGQVELARVRAAIQLLDVEQHRPDPERRVHEPVRQRVERERVVRARRVAERQFTHRATSSTSRGVAA